MPMPALCPHLCALRGGCSGAFPEFSQHPQQRFTTRCCYKHGGRDITQISFSPWRLWMLFPLSFPAAVLYQLQSLKNNSWHLFEQRALSKAYRSRWKKKMISFLSLDFGSDSEKPDGLESRGLLFFYPIPLLLLHLMFVTREHFFSQSIQPVTGGWGCLTPSPPFLEEMLIKKLHSRAETTRN